MTMKTKILVKDIAGQMGFRPAYISQVISGIRPISRSRALVFQQCTGIAASVWLYADARQICALLESHFGEINRGSGRVRKQQSGDQP